MIFCSIISTARSAHNNLAVTPCQAEILFIFCDYFAYLEKKRYQ